MNKTLGSLFLTLLMFVPGLAGVKNTSHVHIAELIQPAPKASILENEGYFVWGASMVQTDDGTCHLYYTRWPKPLFKSWITDAEIAYAKADKPSGPYVFQNVLLGNRGDEFWDGTSVYNPQIIHAEGKYYLYYTGNNGGNRLRKNKKGRVITQRIGAAVAEHPSGPWKRFDAPLIDISEEGIDSNFTCNPAVTPTPEGNYLMIYKCGAGSGRKVPVYHTAAMALAPLGPFDKTGKKIFDHESIRFPAEDPFVWCQNNTFYALLKDMHGTFSAAGLSLVQFESRDGVTWHPSKPALVSRRIILWNDGTQEKVDRLERPQIWLKNGKPAMLFLAVRKGAHSYNVHVPLNAGDDNLILSDQGKRNGFIDYLNDKIPKRLERYAIPGASFALVRKGKMVWSGAYGFADLKQGRPMTVDDICRAESISKPVTAWGVMNLVEQGRLDLDAPITQYLHTWKLPESNFSRQEITVRRLLSNSAGMPLGVLGGEYPPGSDMPSLREYLSIEAKPVQKPGEGFLYSNVGFNLLEMVIEEVTGRNFAEYMADEILIPLGMHDSSFAWKESFHDRFPMGYELGGTPVPPYVYPAHASGGLMADVEDIARFISAGMTSPDVWNRMVLSRKGVQQLHTKEVDIPGIFGFVADGYGLGHFIEDLPGGRKAVWHGGQGHGWMTHFHAVPGSGDGIVIFTNSQRSWPFMGQVLDAWAEQNRFGSIKMGRIKDINIGLQVLIILTLLVSLWLCFRLIHGLRSGMRRFAPFSSDSVCPRILKAGFGLGLIAVVAWRVSLPYIFESSIFPRSFMWAAGLFLMLGIVEILTALFPRRT